MELLTAHPHIHANVRSYNTMLHGLIEASPGNLGRCYQLFDAMNRRGIAPDMVTMNVLTDACVRASNLSAAQKVRTKR